MAPIGGCGSSAKSLLFIKNKTDDSKDKLIWKFIKGAATPPNDLQDPRTTADYALCIYAGTTGAFAGTSSALVAQINVPPDPTKWFPSGGQGYKFFDPTLADDGVQKIVLKAGGTFKSKMLVKGRGANLPDPIDSAPLTLPVTVQLVNYQSGACFESAFTSVMKNTTALFKAKKP
jgi:hypothetical protein